MKKPFILAIIFLFFSFSSFAVLPITGPGYVCIGQTITLSDATLSGTWSSGSGVATVGLSTGVVTGVSAGTAIISYNVGGSYAVQTITVNPLPSAITGYPDVCITSTTILSDATPGGTWSSYDPTVATIGSLTGIVTGIAATSVFISYTIGTGCYVTQTVTVNPMPSSITGVSTVCQGQQTTLIDGGGGTWSSGNIAVATVGISTGVVTGVSAGTATIIYSLPTGCSAGTNVTVHPNPAGITGVTTLCPGTCSTLSDVSTGGTWKSINGAIASVGVSTGLLCGVSDGTDTIVYTLPTGCFVTAPVIANPSPSAISGPSSVCVGYTVTLTDAGGGTWSSSNTAVASIGISTGVVTGLSSGSATITYTLATGCMVLSSITVNNDPVPISGTTAMCVGTVATLIDGTGGGTWSSSNSAVGSVVLTLGKVTGLSVGTTIITYKIFSTGCYVTAAVTVGTGTGTISGLSGICIGSTGTLSDTSPGGTWTSSNTAVATVGLSTGLMTGWSFGVATITYSLGGSCMSTYAVTVDPSPTGIAGVLSICGAGATTTLSDIVGGGIWTSGNTAVATIDAGTGVETGVSAGVTSITYSLGVGCSVTRATTVLPTPAAISGPGSLCPGTAIVLSDAVTGGSWSSSNPTIASIGSLTGIVTGLATGATVISYSTGTACSVSTTVAVLTTPTALSGTTGFCTGSSITLSDAVGGGSWASSNIAVATAGAGTGLITGIAPGTATITYALGSGCYTTEAIVVFPLPASIAGASDVCIGATITLSDASSGGTWSSSNTAIATLGLSTGIATGLASGAFGAIYTLSTGCSTESLVNVLPLPSAISGTSSLCPGGSLTLVDAGGGTWNSSNTSIATIGVTTGAVSGIAAGTATMTYTLSTGCFVTDIITVNPLPASITGVAGVCAGATTTLSDASIGGAWSSDNTAIATIGSASGVASGITAGTATISYTLSTGCSIAGSVTVNPLPGVIAGKASVCTGSTTTLSDGTTGGDWSSGSTSVATIGSASGIVSGITAGTAVITYTIVSSGCAVEGTVTVNALPAVSAAVSSGCGDMDTLTAAGASTYKWLPSSGLSCTACTVTTTSPAATATYTVTGTDLAGCSNTASATVNGNRIFGHISFSSYTPDTLDMKVWLIQFNPTDSSITAQDSVMTCAVDSIGYYEFDGEPAGNYLVKAQLLYGNPPGSSGYVPTYGLSTPNWYLGATVAHTGASDSLPITMVYGTVPPGSGFIGGYVYSGAGKGTTGDVPVAGMLIYLENTSTNILTYVYTDATGAYSFAGLDYGDYIIYPEDYGYYTTPSAVITISSGSSAISNIDFMQYLDSKAIIPMPVTGVKTITATNNISVSPNPSGGDLNIRWNNEETGNADLVLTDVVGREVYRSVLNINAASGEAQADLSELKNGVYFIRIKSEHIYYSAKLVIEK